MSFWKNTILGFSKENLEYKTVKNKELCCSNCGFKTKKDYKFCGKCGKKIGITINKKSKPFKKKISQVESGKNKTYQQENKLKSYEYYLMAFKKFAVFRGRSSRAEFWYFVLYNFIFLFILFFIELLIVGDIDFNDSFLVFIYKLVTLIPSISIHVRRMHDVNKSGWFILIPIYNFILSIFKGSEGYNKYGPNPRKNSY